MASTKNNNFIRAVDSQSLILSLNGPAGPSGPNTVSSQTTTTFVGYLYGNGTNVDGATAATANATANTLVLRDSSGRTSLASLNLSTISTFADNIAAGSLATGTVYRSNDGILRIKY